jgi:hypothetical protein
LDSKPLGINININSRLKQHGHVQCGGRAPHSRGPWPCAGGRQDSHRRTKWRAPASNCGRAVPRRDMGAGRPVPCRFVILPSKPLLTAFSALLYLHKREGARLPASPHPIPMPCTRRRELASSFGWWMHACMVSNSPTRTPPILYIRIWGSRL